MTGPVAKLNVAVHQFARCEAENYCNLQPAVAAKFAATGRHQNREEEIDCECDRKPKADADQKK